MTAIETVLWPGMHRLEPKSKLGGIYANKRGYHNKRSQLPASDYSVAQFAIDREGPANEASAIDWTFPDAQGGNYATISKYSKRLYAARNDPRAYAMREYFGQNDSDKTVEGWDYAKDKASSSDSSHLWHIHISIHRKYINDTRAMEAILSILSGETLESWNARTQREVTWVAITINIPLLREGDDDSKRDGYDRIKRIQRLAGFTGDDVDGVWGPATSKKLGYKEMTEARYRALFGL